MAKEKGRRRVGWWLVIEGEKEEGVVVGEGEKEKGVVVSEGEREEGPYQKWYYGGG